MLKLKLSILWPPDAKNWLIGKDPDAGKDWRWEEKGMTKDEMVGWHHWLDGHEFEQTLGVGDGHGSLVCCHPWGHKELHMTERLNWLNWTEFIRLLSFLKEGSYSSENYEICVCAFWWGEGMVFDWYKSHWFLTMNFKLLLLGSNTSFLIKIGMITINTFLPMRNKFADSCSIKIHALGFNEHFESFSASCWLWEHFACKELSFSDKSGEYGRRGKTW